MKFTISPEVVLAIAANDGHTDLKLWFNAACGMAALDKRTFVTLKDWELAEEAIKHQEFRNAFDVH